jgi:hypothetical protein
MILDGHIIVKSNTFPGWDTRVRNRIILNALFRNPRCKEPEEEVPDPGEN